MLPANCTIEDVAAASTETIYNSYTKWPEKYSTAAVMEMAYQLCLRGL